MSRERGFRIAYQTIKCDRCGASRFRGVPCPDCGRRPENWEIDQELQHRRRELAAARKDLAASDTADKAAGMLIDETVFDDILSLVPRLVPALRRATQPHGDATDVRQLIHDLVEIRRRLARSKERRPYIEVARAAATMVYELEQAVVRYLDALTEAVPLQAQEHADQAQQHIDQAAAAFNDAQDQLESARSVDMSSVAAMIMSLLEVQLKQSGGDAVGMVAAADARLVDLLKVSKPEAGLQLGLIEGVTALEFDRARLTQTVVDAFAAFMAAGPELARLAAAEPDLVKDFLDVQVGAFNSSWNAMHAVQNAQTARQATEALLDINVSLLEAPGAFFARTLLLITGHKQASYAKLKAGNATEDLRSLQTARPELAVLLRGVDDHLRTAKGHYQVTYTDEAITTVTKRETRTTTLVDLHDLVLTGVESVMACVVALTQAFAELGIDIDPAQLTLALGVLPVELAEMSVRLIAQTDASVYLNGDELVVELASSPKGFHLTSLVAALGPVLHQVSRFRVADHGTGRTLTGPTSPFLDKPQGEFDQQLRLINLSLKSQLDGEPAINRDQVRVWVSNWAISAMTAGDAEGMRQLRDLTRLAQQADPELEAAMRRCRRWVSRQEGDLELVGLLRHWRFDGPDWEAV